MGPYKQYVVYEKRRVYIQYVVFYKSDQPVPKLPPVPKSSKGVRQGGITPRVTRTPSPGRRGDQRPPSEDERDTDTGDDDDSWHRLRRRSGGSADEWSSSENVSYQHNDATNTSQPGNVKIVSVVRKRTQALLQSRGHCRFFVNNEST